MRCDSQKSRPSAEHAARPLLVLKHVILSALVAPPRGMLEQMRAGWSVDDRANFEKQSEAHRDAIWQPLCDAGLWSDLSPSEKEHARATAATMTAQQQVSALWRAESAQVLIWALGMLPEPPPYDTTANPEILKQIPSADLPSFVASAELREPGAIDRARSTAESLALAEPHAAPDRK